MTLPDYLLFGPDANRHCTFPVLHADPSMPSRCGDEAFVEVADCGAPEGTYFLCRECYRIWRDDDMPAELPRQTDMEMQWALGGKANQ